jgi:hypothetical protein
MRLVRSTFVALVLGALVSLGAPACRTATEVTVEIRVEHAPCSEIHGTALTIGVEPVDTEQRVKQGFVAATTSSCDGTGFVGTLVVTPSDPMRAAIVVAAAYGSQRDPAGCRPSEDPAHNFENCIVARRTFSFVEHSQLTMPIVLDPDCLNVPCDSLSTCKHGQCYDSSVVATGNRFDEPDKPSDAGGVTKPPPPPPPPAPNDGGNDSGDGGSKLPYCAVDGLHCASKTTRTDMLCTGTTQPCCDSAGVATCGATCGVDPNYCCDESDCAPGYSCSRDPAKGGGPGQCFGETTCIGGTLYCNGARCGSGESCCATPASATPVCTGVSGGCSSNPACCMNGNCNGIAGGGTCNPPAPASVSTCTANSGDAGLPPNPPSCDGAGHLTCGGVSCDANNFCCVPQGGAPADAVCTTTACNANDTQLCCSNAGTQCQMGKTCGLVLQLDGGKGGLDKLMGGVVGGGGNVSSCL